MTMRACDNPFRVQRLARLAYRLEGTTWDQLLARFAALDHRAAIVGPEGHGKSTLLGELGARLEARRFRLRTVTLRRGERQLSVLDRARLLDGATACDLLLVDGAQELAPREWRRLRDHSRHAGGLLITSHRPGLLPTLHECRTTPALLDELMRQLLAGETAIEVAELAAVSESFACHRGNLRDALLAAYDRWSGFQSNPMT